VALATAATGATALEGGNDTGVAKANLVRFRPIDLARPFAI